MKRILIIGLAAAVLSVFAGCALQPLFDGSYFSTTPDYEDLGFFPRGENLALNATVDVSSSLENNMGYIDGDVSKGTWREFALWAGWTKNALNDGITVTGEPGMPGNSMGWSSETAAPDENLPAWIIYDFGKVVEIKAFGMWPRDDAGTGKRCNIPRVFKASWSNDGENWAAIGSWALEESQPAKIEELFYNFDNVVKARYFKLDIEEAGGNFVQVAELAVYGL